MRKHFVSSHAFLPILIYFSGFLLAAGSPLGSAWAMEFEQVSMENQYTARFVSPVDVAVFPDGKLAVLDEREGAVVILSRDGSIQHRWGRQGREPGELNNPRSLALTPDGRIVIADTDNDRVQVFDQTGNLLFSFGNAGSKSGEFDRPTGVAVDQLGFIYVADYNNSRVQSFSPKGVYIASLKTQSRPLDIALDPQRNLYLLMPQAAGIAQYSPQGKLIKNIKPQFGIEDYITRAGGLTVDWRGDIYITEGAEHSVKKFDHNGVVLASFGSEGGFPGQFDLPRGIAADAQGMIFVTDAGNKRVQAFKITGSAKEPLSGDVPAVALNIEFERYIPLKDKAITDIQYRPERGLYALSDREARITLVTDPPRVIGRRGREVLEFREPQGLYVSREGIVYVADTGNDRVQVLTDAPEFDFLFGGNGFKNGQFRNPSAVAVNSLGRIYVADTQNGRIQIFNPQGIFLSRFGDAGETRGQSHPGGLDKPQAVAIDSQDRVYVVDREASHIQVYDPNGQYLHTLGKKGSGPGEFDTPVDIAIDGHDYIYVADRGNNRVQIFDPRGRHVFSFGAYGQGPSYFPKLSAVHAAQGKVYVANYGLDDINVFAFNRELDSASGADPEKDVRALANAVQEGTVKEDGQGSAEPSADAGRGQTQQPADEGGAAASVQKDTASDPADDTTAVPAADNRMKPSAAKAEIKPAALPDEAAAPLTLEGGREYVTKAFYLPAQYAYQGNPVLEQARELTKQEALKELAGRLDLPIDKLESHIRIEREKISRDGVFQLTLSVPKDLASSPEPTGRDKIAETAGNPYQPPLSFSVRFEE